MTHACRSESQAAFDVEEDLASVLAEGIAKLLLHARHWSSSSSKGLQVGIDGTPCILCLTCYCMFSELFCVLA